MNFRVWLYIAAGLFAAGLLLGTVLPADAVAEELTVFDNLAEEVSSMSGIEIFFFILIRNVTAFLTAFFFSPLLLLVPIGSLLLNGAFITIVSRLVLEERSIGFLIAGIMPHGIIEIPAFIFALAASLSFGFAVLRGLFKSGYRDRVAPELKANLRRLGLALLLLIPAALIESFITPVFIGFFN
ncbi:stage II sporulation protein M [Dehalogenimonas sp. THU2]|uniref:stage II sporulation protein M n=1 Tax=Dehalogenimonas sp. THU2 TaxID=3151121 RepID=UPI00321841FD